jgi:AcrR family transcriptional regulator
MPTKTTRRKPPRLPLASESPELWGVSRYERASPKKVAETQRRRLLLGVTQAVAKKGYARTTVADIIEEVRISRRTFYEMFKDVEDCYLAAYEFAHRALIEAIRQSQRGIEDALLRAEQAHRAFLAFNRQHPQAALAFLSGIMEAGPHAAERRSRAIHEFAEMHAVLHRQLRRQHPQLPQVPKAAFLALTAGTNLVVIEHLRRRGPEQLMDLLPILLYLSFSIYGLPAQAQQALERGSAVRRR